MNIVIPAVISAITALIVVFLTDYLTSRREIKAKQEREKINLEYLNPLRLYAVENHFRIMEILENIKPKIKLTEESLNSLASKGIPVEIIQNLKNIKNRIYTSRNEFVRNLKEKIGDEKYSSYGFQILENINIEGSEKKCEPLTEIENPEKISEKPIDWYNGSGCYLISSTYLTASLFYYIKKVREDFPYLRLTKDDDTTLLTLLLKVNLGFLRNLGVFYATQPSIGNDMYLKEENRLLTYKEFSENLTKKEKRVWFDRLIQYFIDTGNGINLNRVNEVLIALEKLSLFLDEIVGGGRSIKNRFETEGIKSL